MSKPDTAQSVEQLCSDLHDLIFDIQEARTMDDIVKVNREGLRIVAALGLLFRD